MKLKEYIDNLNQLVKEKPELLELDVIYAKDAEGNGFEELYYGPTVGCFTEDFEFVSLDQYEDHELDETNTNSICIN